MQKILNKNQKNILGLMILLVMLPGFLFLLPKKSYAFWGFGDVTADSPSNIANGAVTSGTTSATAVSTAATSGTSASGLGIATNTWYGKLLDQALMAIARKAIGEITKSTVNWINSGFHGSPLFLENPQSFFNDIAKYEIKNMVDTFGYDSLKFPFGKDFALNTIASYKRTLENNTAYTLSNVIKDSTILHNYQNNFNYGGWNAFLVNTQYPQNNYIGFQMTATEELARRVQGTGQTAVNKVKDTLQQGQGFLSPQICDPEVNPKYNNMVNEFQKPLFPEKEYRDKNPSSVCTDQACLDKWRDDYDKAKADWAEKNSCVRKDGKSALINTTPGTVVSNQITMALGSQFRQSELGAAMGNSLSQIFDALLNKFIGEGLSALSSNTNPTTTPVDNWTYLGQSLSGPGDSDWANGPDQEVILRDFRILIEGKTVVTFKTGQQLLNNNGELLVYGDKNPITCKDGDKIVDSDGNTIEFCTRGEPISCKQGEKIVGKDHYEDNIGIACTGEKAEVQYHTPGAPILAEGGETVTLIGDKSLDSNGSIREEREYFAGDIENTVQELAVMDNPCDPDSPDYKDCLYTPIPNAKKPTGFWSNYWTEDKARTFKVDNNYMIKYHPGITQIINPLIDATQFLDWCIPGPDKGWEKRLDEEKILAKRKLDIELSLDDKLVITAVKSLLNDLNFAVSGFKDWIETEMETTLQGSIFYLDAVKDIDDISQQLTDLNRSKKAKSQALIRLNVLQKLLKDMATRLANNKKPDGTPDPLTQPQKGSNEENKLISYKKQYDAVKSSISSTRTLEDSKNQLQILKDKLFKLTNTNPTDLGALAKCNQERKEQWHIPIEQEGAVFCTRPIRNGYSHGTTIRRFDAGYIENRCSQGNPSDCVSKDAPIDPTKSYDRGPDISNWFTFRNLSWAQYDSNNPELPDRLLHDEGDVECRENNKWGELVDFNYTTGKCEGNGVIVADYRDLPMVNARNIEGDGGGRNLVKIDIQCEPIMTARKSDYTNAGDLSSSY